MKFTLQSSPKFWWPVTVKMPHPENAGETQKQTLHCRFEGMTRTSAMAAIASGNDADYLKSVVTDWRDVHDEDGHAVTFTPEAFDRALDQPWFRAGLMEAIAEAARGEQLRKN